MNIHLVVILAIVATIVAEKDFSNEDKRKTKEEDETNKAKSDSIPRSRVRRHASPYCSCAHGSDHPLILSFVLCANYDNMQLPQRHDIMHKLALFTRRPASDISMCRLYVDSQATLYDKIKLPTGKTCGSSVRLESGLADMGVCKRSCHGYQTIAQIEYTCLQSHDVESIVKDIKQKTSLNTLHHYVGAHVIGWVLNRLYCPLSIVTEAPTQTTSPRPELQPTTQEPCYSTEPTEPIAGPTDEPIAEPTDGPIAEPTAEPIAEPTDEPIAEPTAEPIAEPTPEPIADPTDEPIAEPTVEPTIEPTRGPTAEPTLGQMHYCSAGQGSDYRLSVSFIFCINYESLHDNKIEDLIKRISYFTGKPVSDINMYKLYIKNQASLYANIKSPLQNTCNKKSELESGLTDLRGWKSSYNGYQSSIDVEFTCSHAHEVIKLVNKIKYKLSSDSIRSYFGVHMIAWALSRWHCPLVITTAIPTAEPTGGPTAEPTLEPTAEPTTEPTRGSTADPTDEPTVGPTSGPITEPTAEPTVGPTSGPITEPTAEPITEPTAEPTRRPTAEPTMGQIPYCSIGQGLDYRLSVSFIFCINYESLHGNKIEDLIKRISYFTGKPVSDINMYKLYITNQASLFDNIKSPLQNTCNKKSELESGLTDLRGWKSSYNGYQSSVDVEFTCSHAHEVIKLVNKIKYKLSSDSIRSYFGVHMIAWALSRWHCPLVITTAIPTAEPTGGPTAEPTLEPTAEPTTEPTRGSTAEPTDEPTVGPTSGPITEPTAEPTVGPTSGPITVPTAEPTVGPTSEPTSEPTAEPTVGPTSGPITEPTAEPTRRPTAEPTMGQMPYCSIGQGLDYRLSVSFIFCINYESLHGNKIEDLIKRISYFTGKPVSDINMYKLYITNQASLFDNIKSPLQNTCNKKSELESGLTDLRGWKSSYNGYQSSVDVEFTCSHAHEVRNLVNKIKYKLSSDSMRSYFGVHMIAWALSRWHCPLVITTRMPTGEPTVEPTGGPTSGPITEPTAEPTVGPTREPTGGPTAEPTGAPTAEPTSEPTRGPTAEPTVGPTSEATSEPTVEPTVGPTREPTGGPTAEPTGAPTAEPTSEPTRGPTAEPTVGPTSEATSEPTVEPTVGQMHYCPTGQASDYRLSVSFIFNYESLHGNKKEDLIKRISFFTEKPVSNINMYKLYIKNQASLFDNIKSPLQNTCNKKSELESGLTDLRGWKSSYNGYQSSVDVEFTCSHAHEVIKLVNKIKYKLSSDSMRSYFGVHMVAWALSRWHCPLVITTAMPTSGPTTEPTTGPTTSKTPSPNAYCPSSTDAADYVISLSFVLDIDLLHLSHSQRASMISNISTFTSTPETSVSMYRLYVFNLHAVFLSIKPPVGHVCFQRKSLAKGVAHDGDSQNNFNRFQTIVDLQFRCSDAEELAILIAKIKQDVLLANLHRQFGARAVGWILYKWHCPAFKTTQGTVTTKQPATTQDPETTPGPVTTRGPVTTPDPITTQEPGTTADPMTTQDPGTTADPVTTQESGATPDPVTTQDPGATPDPVTTQDPGATPGPVTTQDPGATPDPITTQDPGATPDPVTTQDPGTTPDPITTQDPGATPDPVTTQDPGTTPDPITTQDPGATPDPVTTQDPAATPDPVTTQDPGATPDPITTQDPGATPGPVTTRGPVTTPNPVTTQDPGATPDPVTTRGPGTTPGQVTTRGPVTTPGPVTTQDPGTTTDPVTTQEPGATPDPVTTQDPAATPDPVTTQDPGATPDPVTTQDPGATPGPVTTRGPVTTPNPVTTQDPGATPDPVTTQDPAATPDPVTTQDPGATPDPVTTQDPGATPGPVTTRGPVTTPNPVTTQDPGATPDPVTTQDPAATPDPVTTRGPGTTPDPVTTDSGSAICRRPVLANPIGSMNATVGQMISFEIPTSTFFDAEDGNTRSLSLSLNPMMPHDKCWYTFNSTTQILEGLPYPGLINKAAKSTSIQFNLTAVDSCRLSVTDNISLDVFRPSRQCFELNMRFMTSSRHNCEWRPVKAFLERLASYYGFDSQRDMSVVDYGRQSNSDGLDKYWIRVSFSQDIIKCDVCDTIATANLTYKVLQENNYTVHRKFSAFMSPFFTVSRVSVVAVDACATFVLPLTQKEVTGVPFWVWLIPVIIFIVALALTCLLALCRYCGCCCCPCLFPVGDDDDDDEYFFRKEVMPPRHHAFEEYVGYGSEFNYPSVQRKNRSGQIPDDSNSVQSAEAASEDHYPGPTQPACNKKNGGIGSSGSVTTIVYANAGMKNESSELSVFPARPMNDASNWKSVNLVYTNMAETSFNGGDQNQVKNCRTKDNFESLKRWKGISCEDLEKGISNSGYSSSVSIDMKKVDTNDNQGHTFQSGGNEETRCPTLPFFDDSFNNSSASQNNGVFTKGGSEYTALSNVTKRSSNGVSNPALTLHDETSCGNSFEGGIKTGIEGSTSHGSDTSQLSVKTAGGMESSFTHNSSSSGYNECNTNEINTSIVSVSGTKGILKNNREIALHAGTTSCMNPEMMACMDKQYGESMMKDSVEASIEKTVANSAVDSTKDSNEDSYGCSIRDSVADSDSVRNSQADSFCEDRRRYEDEVAHVKKVNAVKDLISANNVIGSSASGGSSERDYDAVKNAAVSISEHDTVGTSSGSFNGGQSGGAKQMNANVSSQLCIECVRKGICNECSGNGIVLGCTSCSRVIAMNENKMQVDKTGSDEGSGNEQCNVSGSELGIGNDARFQCASCNRFTQTNLSGDSDGRCGGNAGRIGCPVSTQTVYADKQTECVSSNLVDREERSDVAKMTRFDNQRVAADHRKDIAENQRVATENQKDVVESSSTVFETQRNTFGHDNVSNPMQVSLLQSNDAFECNNANHLKREDFKSTVEFDIIKDRRNARDYTSINIPNNDHIYTSDKQYTSDARINKQGFIKPSSGSKLIDNASQGNVKRHLYSVPQANAVDASNATPGRQNDDSPRGVVKSLNGSGNDRQYNVRNYFSDISVDVTGSSDARSAGNVSYGSVVNCNEPKSTSHMAQCEAQSQIPLATSFHYHIPSGKRPDGRYSAFPNTEYGDTTEKDRREMYATSYGFDNAFKGGSVVDSEAAINRRSSGLSLEERTMFSSPPDAQSKRESCAEEFKFVTCDSDSDLLRKASLRRTHMQTGYKGGFGINDGHRDAMMYASRQTTNCDTAEVGGIAAARNYGISKAGIRRNEWSAAERIGIGESTIKREDIGLAELKKSGWGIGRRRYLSDSCILDDYDDYDQDVNLFSESNVGDHSSDENLRLPAIPGARSYRARVCSLPDVLDDYNHDYDDDVMFEASTNQDRKPRRLIDSVKFIRRDSLKRRSSSRKRGPLAFNRRDEAGLIMRRGLFDVRRSIRVKIPVAMKGRVTSPAVITGPPDFNSFKVHTVEMPKGAQIPDSLAMTGTPKTKLTVRGRELTTTTATGERENDKFVRLPIALDQTIKVPHGSYEVNIPLRHLRSTREEKFKFVADAMEEVLFVGNFWKSREMIHYRRINLRSFQSLMQLSSNIELEKML
eukprot:gene18768-20659_t